MVNKPINRENLHEPDNGNGYQEAPLFIEGLPDGLEIADNVEDPKPILFSDFRTLIFSDKWGLSFEQLSDSEALLKIDSKAGPFVTRVDGQTVIDTCLATATPVGLALLQNNGYSENFPIINGPYIFRGISQDEMRLVIERNTVKSSGQAVQYTGGDEGKTFFTPHISMARSYAEKPGRFPCAHNPVLGESNYILVVKPHDTTQLGVDEVGLDYDVPIDQVTAVIEVRPWLFKRGTVPLKVKEGKVFPERNVLNLWRTAPQFLYVYRNIDISEL